MSKTLLNFVENYYLKYMLRKKFLAMAFVVASFVLVAPGITFAATDRTWTGGTSMVWNTSTNWSPSTSWVAGDSAIFNAAGPGNVSLTGGITVGNITFNDDRLITGNTLALSNTTITQNSASSTIVSTLAGTTGLIKTGIGTTTLRATSYSGTTTVSAGTLVTAKSNVIPDSSALEINGGTFKLGGNDTVNGIFGTGGLLDLGSYILYASSTLDMTYSGNIVGRRTGGSNTPVNLWKDGVGKLTLTGDINMSVDLGLVDNNNRIQPAVGELVLAGNLTLTNVPIYGVGVMRITAGTNVLSGGSMAALIIQKNGQFFIDGGNTTVESVSVGYGTNGGAGSSPTLTINSGILKVTDQHNLNLGNGVVSGVTPVINLNGGTLKVYAIANTGGSGLNTINFNGGKLQFSDASLTSALRGDANSAGNYVVLKVGDGGAIFETNVTNDIGLSLQKNGNGGLTKLGTGTIRLTANNTYVGETLISNGTLQVGNNGTAGTLGTGGAVINNSNLAFNRSDDLTVVNDISGTGNLQKLGAGTATLSSATVSYTGDTTVATGTLAFSNVVPSSNNWSVSVTNSSTYSKIVLPNNPNLSGKTINIQSTASDSGYSNLLVSWTGTAAGTPTLKLNGTTVTSGQLVNNNTIITYSATDGVTFTRVLPTLSPVSISSNNSTPSLATVGNTITLSFTSSESINSPSVVIAGHSASVLGSGTSWSATTAMLNSDTEGVITFSINFTDLYGNSGLAVISTTDSSSVTFSKPSSSSNFVLSASTPSLSLTST
ncbi:MAG: autotransporter-associated beta strand repeat-containing protein, partial [bacterium]